jgi:hypothetical protein
VVGNPPLVLPAFVANCSNPGPAEAWHPSHVDVCQVVTPHDAHTTVYVHRESCSRYDSSKQTIKLLYQVPSPDG